MTFLYPLFLFLSLFIIVPIVLFFLKKPKVKRINLPTLKFLKQASRSKKKKLSIKEIIILLLRILLVILIAFCISAPVIKDKLTVNDRKTIILVDNSLSFLNFYTLKEYKETIDKKVNKLKKQYSIDYIRYVYMGEKEIVLRKDLSDMKVSYIYSNIEEMFEKTNELFPDEDVNIIVFSDCQNISDKNEKNKLNIVDISREWKSNVFVESVNRQKLYFQNKTSKISFILKNTSNQNQNIQTKLFINDELSSIGETLVQRKSSREIFFDITPKNIGFNKVILEISGDDFPRDNIYYTGLFSDYRFLIGFCGKKINRYIDLAFSKNISQSPFIFEELSQINIDKLNAVMISDKIDRKQLSSLNTVLEKGIPIFILAPHDKDSIDMLKAQALMPFEIVDTIKGNFKIIGEPILDRFLFWKKYLLNDIDEKQVRFRFDDGTPAILEYTLGRSKVYFYNMFFDKENTNIIFSPYFVLYWYNNFTNFQDNTKRFSNIDCNFDHNRPGIYKDDNGKYIFVNIDSRESDFSTYRKRKDNLSLSDPDLIRGDLDLSRYLAFLALLVFITENILVRRWT